MSSIFSVPIFFIIFRMFFLLLLHYLAFRSDLGETVEAGIIVSVLLSFVDQLMTSAGPAGSSVPQASPSDRESTALLQPISGDVQIEGEDGHEERQHRVAIARRMKFQIWAGTLSGLAVSIAIGAAFIAIVCSEINQIGS